MSTDMYWLGLIAFLFIGIGTILPFINAEFSTSISEVDTGTTTEGITHNSVGILEILWTTIKMATWSFGDLPFWLEIMFFLPLRIIFYYLIYRNVRGIG